MKKRFTVYRIIEPNAIANYKVLVPYIPFDKEINALKAVDEMVNNPANKDIEFTILPTYTKD